MRPPEGQGFRLRVHARTVTYTIEALPGETLLTAMERAGIAAPAPAGPPVRDSAAAGSSGANTGWPRV